MWGVQRQEKAAKVREANSAKSQGEITEAQSLLALTSKSLKEERAAVQRDESKLARREKQIDDRGHDISVQEKEWRAAGEAQKAAIAKCEFRSPDLERPEEQHAPAAADLQH